MLGHRAVRAGFVPAASLFTCQFGQKRWQGPRDNLDWMDPAGGRVHNLRLDWTPVEAHWQTERLARPLPAKQFLARPVGQAPMAVPGLPARPCWPGISRRLLSRFASFPMR